MEDQIETNEKRSAGNKAERKCVKCGDPQPITQFAKHMRNCDG